MSDLPASAADLPPTNEPLRIAVRRLRWFQAAFASYVAATGTRIGCTYEIDDAKLAGIFVRWLRAVERQKPRDAKDRQAYFEFAAGLMLRELTEDLPLKATAPPTQASAAAAFWPEGYACTMFCLTVHAEALKQEFRGKPEVSPAIRDLRLWWSFKENARTDAAYSVGFLQTLLGHQPNWVMPDVFRARLSEELLAP